MGKKTEWQSDRQRDIQSETETKTSEWIEWKTEKSKSVFRFVEGERIDAFVALKSVIYVRA